MHLLLLSFFLIFASSQAYAAISPRTEQLVGAVAHTSVSLYNTLNAIKNMSPSQRHQALSFKNILTGQLHSFAICLGHELGHAITAKLLLGEWPNIFIGSSYATGADTWELVNGLHINYPFPCSGRTEIGMFSNAANWKKGLIVIAGGVSGALTAYFLDWLQRKPYDSATSLGIEDQLVFQTIIPCPGNDAEKLWQLLGYDPTATKERVAVFFLARLIYQQFRFNNEHEFNLRKGITNILEAPLLMMQPSHQTNEHLPHPY